MLRPAMASTPKLRLGGWPSKLQPSPPSDPRIILGARSRSFSGTRSNTWGGSLMWLSAETTNSLTLARASAGCGGGSF